MKNNSISTKLALKYMLVVALITLLVCSVFFGALYVYVSQTRNSALSTSLQKVKITIEDNGIEELDFIELPYFINVSIFDKESGSLIYGTDSILPLIHSKHGKITEHYEKNFYTDSDLRLSVLSDEIILNNKPLIIQCAIDIENDSLSKMIKGLPSVLLLCFIPVLAISFLLIYLISRQAINTVKKLENAFEKEKSFTANVSHELKTPIAIIDGHANLIKRWGKENPQQLENSINVILEETENMNNIIQTLLELSKIEKGVFEIHKSTFFISNLFAKIRSESNINHKNIEIKIEDNDFTEINTDENILHEILTALISNSIKFAGENCKIILRSKKNNDKVQIEVEDNGPGFSLDTLPYIFERFYKGDKSHTRNGSGAGLGLAISKALCQALDGEIYAANSCQGGAIIGMWIK